MGQFDIYKWNSERRLAAVNEGVEEVNEPISREQAMYNMYDEIVALVGGDFRSEFPSATDFERRMRKHMETLSEGAMDRDQIAYKLFRMDYDMLDPNKKKEVDGEYEKDIHNK